jgi:hypothetical protein
MNGNKVNKCHTSVSGRELWSAITNRLTPIQRTAKCVDQFTRSWIPVLGQEYFVLSALSARKFAFKRFHCSLKFIHFVPMDRIREGNGGDYNNRKGFVSRIHAEWGRY